MKTFLRGATLLDGTGAEPFREAAVLIEGDSIAAVGRLSDFGSAAEEARDVDLTGQFLLPGFVNVHEHVTNKRVRGTRTDKLRMTDEKMVALGIKSALLDLQEGITTIRDLGSKNGISRTIKEVFDEGMILGPNMVDCPLVFTVSGGYAHHIGVEVDSPDEARKAAGKLVKEGCDWVKCMASIEWERAEGEPISAVNMPRELIQEIYAVAHHHGKGCTAHAVHDDAIRNAVEAGADSIEHGIMLSRETAEFMAGRGVYLVPTFSGYIEHCKDWGRGAGVIKHGLMLQEYHGRAFRNALDAGVKFAYGSDTLGNLVDEVQAMQENGASPAACVVAATRNGANLLGLDAKVGTVAPGKLADMVVLKSDPLASPRAFGDVGLTIKSGHLLDPAQIPITSAVYPPI
jgi:imidazolonepropionase-like amidohydrolase